MASDKVTAATLKKWIRKRALEIGDEFAERSKEYASKDVRMADYYYAQANGAWAVVKAITLGSYRPVKVRRKKART
jgi:hypothetical protein